MNSPSARSRNFIRGGGGTPQKGPPMEKRGPKQNKLVAELKAPT